MRFIHSQEFPLWRVFALDDMKINVCELSRKYHCDFHEQRLTHLPKKSLTWILPIPLTLFSKLITRSYERDYCAYHRLPHRCRLREVPNTSSRSPSLVGCTSYRFHLARLCVVQTSIWKLTTRSGQSSQHVDHAGFAAH